MELHQKDPVQEADTGDRRAQARTATVFKPVLMETDDFAGFCLIRNLSGTGLMGHAFADFPVNVLVTIHLGLHTVKGTLVWCSEGRIGVQFDQIIDVNRTLAQLAAPVADGRLNRAPRLRLQCHGDLIIGDRTLRVEVKDVSQRGIKIVASFIRPGDELYVEIAGLERRKAVVRWTQGELAGLSFMSPLSFEQLASWAVLKQTEKLPTLCSASNS